MAEKPISYKIAYRSYTDVQVSAWGSRPLHPEQLAYAGADAHVLTAIYDSLVSNYLQVQGQPLRIDLKIAN